jgi:septum formation protein
MTEVIKLASASPERLAILEDLGYAVDVCPVDLDETPMEDESASQLVLRLAREKMRASHGIAGWTIAADTVVEVSGEVKGKPKNEDEARATLLSLQQAEITVWTATAMTSPEGEEMLDVSSAELTAKIWSMDEVEQYLRSQLWKGRAGSFSIFHDPTPVILKKGRLDVVRGLNGQAVLKAIGEVG